MTSLFVILAAASGDWEAQGKSYQFFTRTDFDGVFSIHTRQNARLENPLQSAESADRFTVGQVMYDAIRLEVE